MCVPARHIRPSAPRFGRYAGTIVLSELRMHMSYMYRAGVRRSEVSEQANLAGISFAVNFNPLSFHRMLCAY
ncbi:hypothetical protein EVAR_38847_1 [Eumeta japonica]|uniref:Uncharacterized protein n=1 Tax=Eumeta variegata TaxID=151549 RepID=A0A4C1XPT6_EUMVA|nr:hypothetical protein EVAR_38847_1 [Eumeta japonica]